MHILQTKQKCLDESFSWEEVECAQPTQEQLHDESAYHVEQLKCTYRRENCALQTWTSNQTECHAQKRLEVVENKWPQASHKDIEASTSKEVVINSKKVEEEFQMCHCDG